MKKRLLALSLAMSVFVVGCSTNTDEIVDETVDEVQNESIEKILYTNGGPQEFFEVPWLNPGTFAYNRVLYDRLILADENLNPIEETGQLASSYVVSEDGMQITFTIRDDAFWHDGEPVTPQDIKWSIEYALESPAINSVFLTTFQAIDEILIDGQDLTVIFATIAPDALLTFTQFSPLPEKYFEGIDAITMQQSTFFQNPIGSGPFAIGEVKMNNYTTLIPFEDYYDGVADFTLYLTPSAGDSDSNFVTNAKAGLLDYGYTKNISDVKALEGTDGINIEQVDVRYTRLLYLNKFDDANGDTSPLADVRVRQALNYALDMETILQGVFEGAASPANSLTPTDKPDGLNDYDYDIDKAKELLAEANWDENTVLDLVYYYTDQQTVDLMTILQHYWAQAGVKMNFRLVEGDLSTLLWEAPTDPVNGPSAVNWDICYAANAALSLHEYYDRYQTGYAINSHTPSDALLDELILATNSTTDATVAREAFHELIKYENEELFVFPLYYQPVFVITSDKIISGVENQGNPQFNFDWQIQNWSIK